MSTATATCREQRDQHHLRRDRARMTMFHAKTMLLYVCGLVRARADSGAIITMQVIGSVDADHSVPTAKSTLTSSITLHKKLIV